MQLTPRQQAIFHLARERRLVMVDDLADRFGVTRQTIRRDLNEMVDRRVLSRTHGGAMLAGGVANLGYADRRAHAGPAKAAIAAAAARDIPNDCSLFLTIGTTTEAVARALIDHRNLLVITNSLNVAQILSANPEIEVIVAGGVLRRADNGLVGEATLDLIAQFKVDQAIIGVSAVDADGSLLDFDVREVRAVRAVLENARRSVLVTDRSKFQRAAPVRIAPLAALDALYTDGPPPPDIAALCRRDGVAVTVAQPAPGEAETPALSDRSAVA